MFIQGKRGMLGEIFEDNQTVEYNRSIYSIKGCKYQCVDGYYFEPNVGKYLLCPDCKAKKREIVLKKLKDKKDNKTILEKLNLPKLAKVTDHLEDRELIPEKLKTFYTEESLKNAREDIIDLYRKASGGQTLTNSYVFALPSYDIRYEDYISAIMLKMYSEGVKIAPFVYADDLAKVDLAEQEGIELNTEIDLDFYYKADVVVMCYSGTYRDTVFTFVQNFLNKRGNKYNKPTILVLTTSLSSSDGKTKPTFWFTTDKKDADNRKPYCVVLEKRKDKEVQPKPQPKEMSSNMFKDKPQVRHRLNNVYTG